MNDRRAAIKKLAMGLAGGTLVRGGLARGAQQMAQSVSPPAAGQPFDFAWLKGQAHWLASNAYQASKDTLPPAMGKLGYNEYQSIRFKTDHALWADAGVAFRVQFFHVGRSFTEAVHLYEVTRGSPAFACNS
jgi:periplasmic glucans biosynthesis protein